MSRDSEGVGKIKFEGLHCKNIDCDQRPSSRRSYMLEQLPCSARHRGSVCACLQFMGRGLLSDEVHAGLLSG